MPPIDGTTIGVILAGVVSLVTALGTIQTRRDTNRRKEIADLRRELTAQRKMNVAAVRYIYGCQLVLAARGVPDSSLPPLPDELKDLFDGAEPGSDQPAADQRNQAGPQGDGSAAEGERRRHRRTADPEPA